MNQIKIKEEYESKLNMQKDFYSITKTTSHADNSIQHFFLRHTFDL